LKIIEEILPEKGKVYKGGLIVEHPDTFSTMEKQNQVDMQLSAN